MSTVSLRDVRLLEDSPTDDERERTQHDFSIISPTDLRRVLITDDLHHRYGTLTGDRDLSGHKITVGSLDSNKESGRKGWTLWRRGNPAESKVYLFDSTVHCKGSSNGVQLTVNVDGIKKSQVPGEKLRMILTPVGKVPRYHVWESRTHNWREEDGKDDVSEFIFTFNARLGGLCGNFSATIHAVEDEKSSFNVQETASLEFYWLQAAQLPSYFDKGIPLALLRMFLLPATTQQVYNFPTSNWVELATKIVHGSCKPFSGLSCSTSEHWLKYEASWGNNSFMSEPRGTDGFDLQAWLDVWRLYDQNQKITTVNCYDQAAALEVVLTLGMPYKQIAWEYHVVYGYIYETELVGWGPCNNPYFDYDGPKVLSDYDYSRTLFRNHAYLCWNTDRNIEDSTMDEYNKIMKRVTTTHDYSTKAKEFEKKYGLNLKMIDACAGPHIGTESREEYERGIWRVTPPWSHHENIWVKKWADPDYTGSTAEEHYMGRGILSLSKRKESNIHQFGNTMGPRFEAFVRFADAYLATYDEDLVVNSRYSDLVSKVQKAVEDVHPNWSGLAFVPVRDVQHAVDSHDAVLTRELKFQYKKHGKRPEKCFVSVRFTLMPSASEARKRLNEELAMNALTTENHPTKCYVQITEEDSTKINVIGAGSLRAFLFYNLAIRIEGPELWSDDPGCRFGKAILEFVRAGGTKRKDESWQDFWKS